jgi:hypothetical protein
LVEKEGEEVKKFQKVFLCFILLMTSTYLGYGNEMVADTTDEPEEEINEGATGGESEEESGSVLIDGSGEEISEGFTGDGSGEETGIVPTDESGEEISEGTTGGGSGEVVGSMPTDELGGEIRESTTGEGLGEETSGYSDEEIEAKDSTNTVVKQYTVKLEGDNHEQSKSISIPDLLDIVDVSTNTGDVDYTVDGDQILLNLSNSNITKKVQTGGSYIPADIISVTKSRETSLGESVSSLPSSISYNSDGYSGTLSKSGLASVISGSYSPSDSKNVSTTRTSSSNSFSSSISYNSGGYTGTLYKDGSSGGTILSGSYSPSDSKYVTGQTSSYYNSGGYSGVLSSYVHSGSYIPSDSKTVSTGTSTITWGGHCINGSTGETGYKSKPSVPYTKSYNSGGYSGTLYKRTSSATHPDPVATCGIDTTPLYRYAENYWYSGTVTKPAVDSRVYRYRGTVSKPAVDTRVWSYSQDYSGIVYKPSTDTRTWKQDYSGEVTKPAVDTRTYETQYVYEVTIQYHGLPSTLGMTAAGVNDLGATIKWSDVDAASYELYRDDSLIYQGGNLSYREESLVSDTSYNYSLKATYDNGKKVEESIQVTTPPGSLSILSVPAHVYLPDTTLMVISKRLRENLIRK